MSQLRRALRVWEAWVQNPASLLPLAGSRSWSSDLASLVFKLIISTMGLTSSCSSGCWESKWACVSVKVQAEKQTSKWHKGLIFEGFLPCNGESWLNRLGEDAASVYRTEVNKAAVKKENQTWIREERHMGSGLQHTSLDLQVTERSRVPHTHQPGAPGVNSCLSG